MDLAVVVVDGAIVVVVGSWQSETVTTVGAAPGKVTVRLW